MKNLELILSPDNSDRTVTTYQYTAQPLGISRTFYPDALNRHRAHLYRMSTSPGLLADDTLTISIKLQALAQLYLAEQSATKVHPMPQSGTKATVNYTVEIGERACLEFVPEPIILFKEATFEQTALIRCHDRSRLFWSEIVVPGRLARGEFYDFFSFSNRLQVTSSTGELWLMDAMTLLGQDNPFKNSHLLAGEGILGSALLIFPHIAKVSLLKKQLDALEISSGLRVATSLLPYQKGLAIKAIASGTYGLKRYFTQVLQCFREVITDD